MLNLIKRIKYCWEWFCFIFAIGFGSFLTLVGVVGFITSEHPLEGSCEFMLYGPIVILVVIKTIKPSTQPIT